MLHLLDQTQPWLNAALSLTAGVVGLWAAVIQYRLKRARLAFSFVGSVCLILVSSGLVLTDLEGDANLVRSLILRVLFMLIYLSWGITAVHHLREWRRIIKAVTDG